VLYTYDRKLVGYCTAKIERVGVTVQPFCKPFQTSKLPATVSDTGPYPIMKGLNDVQHCWRYYTLRKNSPQSTLPMWLAMEAVFFAVEVGSEMIEMVEGFHIFGL